MPHAPRPTLRRGSVHALVAIPLAAALTFSGVSFEQGRGSANAVQLGAESDPQPELVVAAESTVLKSTDEQFRFEVLLKNPTSMPLDAGSVTLTIDSHRAESASDLSSEGEREALDLGVVDANLTAGGEDQRLGVVVSRDEFPLLFTREAGVYPVHAEFTADSSRADAPRLRASSALIWNDAATTTPLAVTLVVPLVLPGSVEALPTRDELAAAAARLTQLFDAAEQRHATVAVDPRIIAATRALGSNAPSAAASLLKRLERSASPLFLLQFGDADPAVQAAIGLEALLEPLGFDHAIVPSAFEPPVSRVPEAGEGSEAGETPAGSADPADPADQKPKVDPATGVPTREALLSLDNARLGAWPAGGEVDSATLALLQNAGLTSLVLDSGNLSNATAPRATLGDFEALVADAQAGRAARAAIAGTAEADRAAGAAELAAQLALSAQSGATGLVLALDRGALADTADPLRIFETLDDLPWVHLVPERQQAAGTAELRAGASTEPRRELLRAAMARSAQIDELAPLIASPDYLLQYQRERLLTELATRHAAPGVDFTEIDQQLKKRDKKLLVGVHPLVSENTQLVGSLSNVPITLSNALPFEAVANLHVTPTSAAITLREHDFTVRIPAQGSTNVLVPVQSRVSSGETSLQLEVQNTSKQLSFASAEHPLTLRTAVETVLIWVLGAAAALLLGFGSWRSVRRRRTQGAPI